MSNTSYLSPSSKGLKNASRSHVGSFSSAIVAAIVLVLSVFGGMMTYQEQHKADADIGQWLMCSLIPSFPLPDDAKDVTKNIYQAAQTDDIHFYFRSKSNIVSGLDNVDAGLNWLLEASGNDFKNVNEKITGYSLDPDFFSGEKKTDDEYKANYNKGSYVNPFDRFGVAGLKYSAYIGEWKYFVVDACETKGEATDPKAGLFYEERLEPRSTWDDQSNSRDVRTKQFAKGSLSQLSISAGNNIANGIFSITKTIVVITITFINFSFSDIVSTLGLNNLIASDGGIFKSLFAGIFMPLIFLMFVLTAGYIFYVGIVKRQYRSALTSLLRSLFLFVSAIVIAAAPAFFIALPNQIAVGAQSMILVAMNSTITGGDQMCATDVGSTSSSIVTNAGADDIDILNQTSKNVRSVVGCQLWQMFLLKPWSEGQFGTDWNQLWANDKVPSWANNGKTLGNLNSEMVGDAEVPLGGGKIINNWAIYQISTQTDAHAPTNKQGQRPTTSNGVSNDWWRIVDALANYQEEDTKQSVSYSVTGTDVTNSSSGSSDISYTVPKNNPVLNQWDTWVGNNMFQRIGASFTSVFVAGIGVSSLLFFSALALIYSIGTALLMAFAPLMLLLGCWAPSGYEIFKSWGELVINTVMKRIATGLLLVIAILFVSSIIKMSGSLAWWQLLVALVLISILLIKSRHKIVDMLASFRFATSNFGSTASRLGEKLKNGTVRPVKATGKVAGSAVVAGVASKRNGGSFGKGMFAGVKGEMKNAAYRSPMMREVMTSYESEMTANGKADQLRGRNYCAKCGKSLDYEMDENGQEVFHGGRDKDGNLLCNECMMDNVDEDAQEVIFYKPSQRQIQDKKRLQDEKQHKMYQAFQNKMKGKTHYKSNTGKELLEKAEQGYDFKTDRALGVKQHEQAVKEAARTVNFDIRDYKNNIAKAETDDDRKMVQIPQIPDEIRPYVDENVLEYAWENGKYDYIQGTYAAAFVAWYQENTKLKFSESIDDVIEYIQTGNKPENVEVDDTREEKNHDK